MERAGRQKTERSNDFLASSIGVPPRTPREAMKSEHQEWKSKRVVKKVDREEPRRASLRCFPFARKSTSHADETAADGVILPNSPSNAFSRWSSKKRAPTPKSRSGVDNSFHDRPSGDSVDRLSRRRKGSSPDSMKLLLTDGVSRSSTAAGAAPSSPPSGSAGKEGRGGLSSADGGRPSVRLFPKYEESHGHKEVFCHRHATLPVFERRPHPVSSTYFEANSRPMPWSSHGNILGWDK